MDSFFSSPELFDDFEKKHLLLWDCQAEQERHATRPSTKDHKTEKGRLYGNTVVGQETFAC
jgi:hypothetical protein